MVNLHLCHQGNREFSLSKTYFKTYSYGYQFNGPFLSLTTNLTLVARIGTKLNAAKEAPIANHTKSLDFEGMSTF